MTETIYDRHGTEGHWRSGGDGVRGHMGAHHRMLSTYINDLLAAGFRLEKIEEPLPEDSSIHSQVPRAIIVVGTAE